MTPGSSNPFLLGLDAPPSRACIYTMATTTLSKTQTKAIIPCTFASVVDTLVSPRLFPPRSRGGPPSSSSSCARPCTAARRVAHMIKRASRRAGAQSPAGLHSTAIRPRPQNCASTSRKHVHTMRPFRPPISRRSSFFLCVIVVNIQSTLVSHRLLFFSIRLQPASLSLLLISPSHHRLSAQS